ncbi:MAG TPA: extracellular solute-binding protein [Xanthobacteraceae bacterium]|nr:extracellular solute-binding protein [Xanthobacteraceae bacterium]
MRWLLPLLAAFLLSSPGAAQNANPKPWDDVVAAAKQEGNVVVIGSPDPVMRNNIIPAFTARYGIKVTYIAGGSGELVGKIRVERSSGLYSVDVFMAGNNTTVNVLLPQKMLQPLRPLMVAPDVIDPAKWKSGKLRFIDPEQRYILQLFSTVSDELFLNTDYVKADELRSIRDLLNPRWRGKISAEDPTISGSGGNLAGRLYADLGPDFVKAFYVDQAPLISRDRRLISDSLARGTQPICLTCRNDDVRELIKSGFKIIDVFELEGISPRLRPGQFLLSVADRPPHPDAAQVFVNWIASKEALEIYSHVYGEVSLRTDVDESFLDPRMIPKPGVHYKDDGDFAWIASGRQENSRKARDLLLPLLKAQ